MYLFISCVNICHKHSLSRAENKQSNFSTHSIFTGPIESGYNVVNINPGQFLSLGSRDTYVAPKWVEKHIYLDFSFRQFKWHRHNRQTPHTYIDAKWLAHAHRIIWSWCITILHIALYSHKIEPSRAYAW